jgi:hypothetical protein
MVFNPIITFGVYSMVFKLKIMVYFDNHPDIIIYLNEVMCSFNPN